MVASFETVSHPVSEVSHLDFRWSTSYTKVRVRTLRGKPTQWGSRLRDVYLRVRRYEFESRGEEDCILMGQWPGNSFPRTFSGDRNLTQSEKV